MNRPIILSFLLICSAGQAAPLLTAKTSVVEGNFCKMYGCTLLTRQEIAPETMGLLYYSYKVRGGTLDTGRLSNKAIISATLTVPASQWESKMVQDFLKNFTGVAVEGNTLRRCVRLATYTGNSNPTPLMKGSLGQVNFEVSCLAVKNGQISLIALDSDFQPR